VIVERNACYYFDYRHAEEMLALGLDCAAAEFSRAGR
jgi:hypothetical protein